MSQKRQPQEFDVGSHEQNEKPPKIPSLRRVVMQALEMDALENFCSALEPLVRRVVKEEVELALSKHLVGMKRQCRRQVYPSTSRCLQLQFMTKLCLPIFTGSRIEGEGCSVINIALVDSLTGQIVVSGPESFMKVEIVVLEGDSESEEADYWAFEEFKNNIVTEREGKRPLLTGDVLLDLNEGTTAVRELSFTDNSSWTRSRRFRLGAMTATGVYNGMRVIEAKTEPFIVKDHRGEVYRKHYPPSLGDQVWRLEKIGKDGVIHKRLRRANICTVKDFLTLLNTDAQRLQSILGIGMSSKMWEVIVGHARTCTLNNKMHVYYPTAQRETGVVFNIVGELAGVLSQNQYVPASGLSDDEKADAQALVRVACEHGPEVLPFNLGSVTGTSSYSLSDSIPPTTQYFAEDMHDSVLSLPEAVFGLVHPSINISPFDTFSNENEPEPEPEPCSLSSLDAYKDSMEEQDLTGSAVFDDYENQGFFHEEQLQCFNDDVSLLSQSFCLGSPDDIGTSVTAFFRVSAKSAAANGKANGGWNMLVSVLRWTLSIKRIVASKKGVTHQENKCG